MYPASNFITGKVDCAHRDIDYKLELSFMIFNPNAKAIDIARDFSIVDFVKQYFDSQENEIDMLFYAGEIIVEPGADKILFLERPDEDLTDILERHVCGDWGEVCQEEKKRNDKALQNGSKIISAYTLSSNKNRTYAFDGRFLDDSVHPNTNTNMR